LRQQAVDWVCPSAVVQIADYGLVEDWVTALPALEAELEKVLAK
jgi:electron transfer flavoprotein alpha subunit